MSVISRITSLRCLMLEKSIDAVIISGTDPHLSEYIPDYWQSREWISGFSGSYGKVAITQTRAALWTDSRYFIQAESQLSGTGITMIRDRQADSITISQWLQQELKEGSIVSINGLTISAAEADTLEINLSAKGISLDINSDLVSPVWKNRPLLPQSMIIDYPVAFAGISRSQKLAQIRIRLNEADAQSTLICQLDDLAWIFNLRGNDINYNPLFMGYGFVDQNEAILFVEIKKLSDHLIDELTSDGIRVMEYESIFSVLVEKNLAKVSLDPDRTNSLIYRFVSRQCDVIDGLSFPTLLKSVKNEVEIAGTREAHLRDGIAMVNFLYWFDKNFSNEIITELTIANKLKEFRADQSWFMGESFCPTVAFGSHGAIVHYSTTPESDVEIAPDGILLIDSGGHYLDGTTDITRTIATGEATLEQKSDFTLVLKGMIQLATAVFPVNTKGHSLDILARKALWDKGLNYGHGTGHGVGHYLSVHEGPMSVRPENNNEPIRAGQILSDEPGLYREGKYGIRIENVLVCNNDCQTDFGNFLSFDTLTMCPIDRKLINPELLSIDELRWVNTYHNIVLTKLKPHLNREVLKWLTAQCALV
ncbi:MAG: aminopeptidase P family protein [Mariniphaga sp.]